MDVKCLNEECEQHDVVKANPADYPAEDIVCGECGGPVVDAATEADTE